MSVALTVTDLAFIEKWREHIVAFDKAGTMSKLYIETKTV
jgi:hypothetical protein